MSIISMENVWHYYFRGTPLETVSLSGFSLDVKKGEFVALVGHTGSGKSTVLQHLNGLLIPHRGRVLVGGADTRDKNVRKRLWVRVGVVLQYPEKQFFEETVFREVSFGPQNLGLEERAVHDRVLEALDMVGISSRVHQSSPYALSGGEQRRLALASILALRPEVLALDEPTAGVDSGGRKRIFETLNRLKDDRGITIVMASHSMEDVAILADRAVVLKEGATLLEGSAREVFSNPGIIKKAGLELPVPCEVIDSLKNKGFGVESTALNVDEAVKAIIEKIDPKRSQ